MRGLVSHAKAAPVHRHLPMRGPTVAHKSQHPPVLRRPKLARHGVDSRNMLQKQPSRATRRRRSVAAIAISTTTDVLPAAAAARERGAPDGNMFEKIVDTSRNSGASADKVRANLVYPAIRRSAVRRLPPPSRAHVPAFSMRSHKRMGRRPRSRGYETARFANDPPIA